MLLPNLNYEYIEKYSFDRPIYELYSLKERLDFFKENRTHILTYKGDAYKTLFSEEEAKELYQNAKSSIYVYMSEEERIKNIDFLDSLSSKEKVFRVCSFNDKDNKKIILNHFFKTKHNLTELSALCDSLNISLSFEEYIKRFSFEELCKNVESLEKAKELINCFNVEDCEKVTLSMLENIKKSPKIELWEGVSVNTNTPSYFMVLEDMRNVRIIDKFYEGLKGERKDIAYNVLFSSVVNKWSSEYLFSHMYKFANEENKLAYLKRAKENDNLSYYVGNFKKMQNIFDNTPEKYKEKVYQLFDSYDAKAFVAFIVSFIDNVEKVKMLCDKYNKDSFSVVEAIEKKCGNQRNDEFLSLVDKYCSAGFLSKAHVVRIMSDSSESYPDAKIKYKNILNSFIDFFEIKNVDRFNKLVDRFGYDFLQFVETSNFNDIMNLKDDKFDKFIKIFDKEHFNLDKNALNTVIHAACNRTFKYEHNYIINIFGEFERCIQNNDKAEIYDLLDDIYRDSGLTIKDIIDSKGDNKLYVYMIGGGDWFVNSLCSGDKKAVDLLHDLTDTYIAKKREDYVKNAEPNFYKVSYFRRSYEKAFAKKNLFYEKDTVKILDFIYKTCDKSKLGSNELALLENKFLMCQVVKAKQIMSINRRPLGDEDREVIKYFKLLEKILDNVHENEGFLVEKCPFNFYDNADTPYTYKLSSEGAEYKVLTSMFFNFDIDCIDKNLLSNDKLYDEFIKSYVKEYKFLSWGDSFYNYFDMAGLLYNGDTLSSMLGYFNKISEKMENVDNSVKTGGESVKKGVTAFIDYANCFSSASNKYKVLLGEENANLILCNPGPNSSSLSREERLKTVELLLPKMYERRFITTPPCDENLELDNGKVINVKIGNFTDKINLTLGERTGACMRVGGIAEELFYTALFDEKGFHVILSHPKTGKFISRVSGVRDGNTVFLNELRFSSDQTLYSNYDLFRTIEKVADMLIDTSQKSRKPIENVIICDQYVMSGANVRKIPEIDNSNVFKNTYFDLKSNSAVVLKSVYKDKLVFKFGEEYSGKYNVRRNDVVCVDDKDDEHFYDNFDRMFLLARVLKGDTIENIDLQSFQEEMRKKDVVRYYYGDDFLVYVDSKGKVHDELVFEKADKEAIEKEIKEIQKQDKKKRK